MKTNFKIKSIQKDYSHLFEMTTSELHKIGAKHIIADTKSGYPCRVSLEDAEIDENLILFHYQHHNTASPYKSSGPIFIRKHAKKAELKVNEIPAMLNHRLLSLRIYDIEGMMIDASTLIGHKLKTKIRQIFSNQKAHYIQVHNAGPGCYNCQVDRV